MIYGLHRSFSEDLSLKSLRNLKVMAIFKSPMLSEWGFDFETKIGPHALISRPICKIFAGKVASCSSSLTLKRLSVLIASFCFIPSFVFQCYPYVILLTHKNQLSTPFPQSCNVYLLCAQQGDQWATFPANIFQIGLVFVIYGPLKFA